MRTHRIFGATLASDFPFAVSLMCCEGPPDLTFTTTPTRLVQAELNPPLYTSPRQLPDGTNSCHLYRLPQCDVLAFPKVTFCLWSDRIVCHLSDAALQHLVEPYLLGPVLSYWLERRSLPVLHAAAVTMDGLAAVAFIASSGVGKSGMAAALLQQGAAFLGDDLVPIEPHGGAIFLARPSFPQMRMWPDEATYFLGRWEHLRRVSPGSEKRWAPLGEMDSGGFGAFHNEATPLSCLYLLDRQPAGDTPIEIREVSPRDALIELLRHSFTPLLVEAAGLQPARFDLLSRLVLSIPVRRLRYPSGFHHLPRVAEAVRHDLDR